MDRRKNNGATPLVTVVVMTYNHERFLRRCLDGIAMQRTDFPFEALVIDDASTDSNPEIIREYAARYPRIFRPFLKKGNGYSRGISRYADTAVPEARGKYMALCEGDDYWTDPGKLQLQADFLESHPKYSCCFHLYRIIEEGREKTPQKIFNLRHSRRCYLHDMLVEMQPQTATMMFRMSLFDHDGELREHMRRGQIYDTRLYLALINYGRAYGICRYMSVYRIHAGGVSQNINRNIDVEARHLRVLGTYTGYYQSRYRHLPSRYCLHLRMRKMLAEATHLRREGKYLRYAAKMARTFLVSPMHFLRIYYTAYR